MAYWGRHTGAEPPHELVVGWVKKHDQTLCCLQETLFKYKDTYILKVNGLRKTYHANNNQKKLGVAPLISDRAKFKESFHE